MDSIYFNQEAEAQLIGLAMSNEECVQPVADLSTEAFYFQEFRTIHDAIRTLKAEGKRPDVVTVADLLKKRQVLDGVGGYKVLLQLQSTAFIPSLLKQYMQIVQECWNRRRQRAAAKEYAKKLDNGEDADECWEWMLRTLSEIKQERDNGLISAEQAVINTVDKLGEDQKAENEGKMRILSGISTLDNKLGGLTGSKYVAIGARPSVGKSVFALTYCVNAAKQGKRVLFVSLEMDEVDITERVLANAADIPLSKMTSGELEENDWEDLGKAMPGVGAMTLWYSLEADTVSKVRRCAYEIYEKGGLDMICIDYIQLMSLEKENSSASRQEEVARISRGLRKLSQELKIPVLVLTQLNRQSVSNSYNRKKVIKREPTMNEARESGAIEQDANIFMLLHQPEKDEMQKDEEKETWENLKNKGYTMMRIIVDKNRQGQRGRVTIAFDGNHMRFLPIVRNVEAPY